MAVNIKVIHTKGFIKTTVIGVLDFSASKRAVHAIVSLIEQPGEHKIFVDTREAESVLSMLDIFKLGETLVSHPTLRGSRIGILTPRMNPQHAGFFETVTSNRGLRAKVFTDFEEAVNWLVM